MSQTPMTPAQALDIIDQATSQFHGTRLDHQKIVEALEVIGSIVKPTKEPAAPDTPAPAPTAAS